MATHANSWKTVTMIMMFCQFLAKKTINMLIANTAVRERRDRLNLSDILLKNEGSCPSCDMPVIILALDAM
ncbi:hypothetical protein D3C79_927670 [compost metagenome]